LGQGHKKAGATPLAYMYAERLNEGPVAEEIEALLRAAMRWRAKFSFFVFF
jgi:hypothetical protein